MARRPPSMFQATVSYQNRQMHEAAEPCWQVAEPSPTALAEKELDRDAAP